MNFIDDIKKQVLQVTNLIKSKSVFVINGRKYIEEKLLGEGGFGYVYLVLPEIDQTKQFALKKINILDKNSVSHIKKEVSLWKSISNHPNIVKLIDYEINNETGLILMEYSSKGSLFKYINDVLIENNQNIDERLALGILKDITSGVNHMHTSQVKPVQHRDIKIENVLIIDGYYKLCDFGSSSQETLTPSLDSKAKIKEEYSVYEKTTTFMYRPPEMVDEYLKLNVNEKVDVWQLGCLLYCLLYKKHPFFDAQKSTISKAFYHFPYSGVYSEKIDDLIRLMLSQSPEERPSASEILSIIKNWSSVNISLSQSALNNKKIQKESTEISSMTLKSDGGFDERMRKAQEEILKSQMKKKYKGKLDFENEDEEDVNEQVDVCHEYGSGSGGKENKGKDKVSSNVNGNCIINNIPSNSSNTVKSQMNSYNDEFDRIFLENKKKLTSQTSQTNQNSQNDNEIFNKFENIFNSQTKKTEKDISQPQTQPQSQGVSIGKYLNISPEGKRNEKQDHQRKENDYNDIFNNNSNSEIKKQANGVNINSNDFFDLFK